MCVYLHQKKSEEEKKKKGCNGQKINKLKSLEY